MATYILKTKDGRVREYWCPDSGGYVREIDAQHPGTLGRQVSDDLSYSGDMMSCHNPERYLASYIRAARRRELAGLRRYFGQDYPPWID